MAPFTPPDAAPPRPADPRLAALLELIDDGDSHVWDAVRRALRSAGREAVGGLRRAARSDAPRARARARLLLAERERGEVHRRLVRHVVRPKLELESALLLLSRLEHPRLDARPYRKALDAMARKVSEGMARARPGLPRAMVLVEYLAHELGFAGSEEDYHHADRIHLHRVIETKCGIPLSLTAVYLLVAQRAGLRAAAVPLPGHVMLRLYAGENDARSVLVDTFHGGVVRTRRECREYLSHHDLTLDPTWFHDADVDSLFLRQVRNLHHSARRRGLGELARGLRSLGEAFVQLRRAGTREAMESHLG